MNSKQLQQARKAAVEAATAAGLLLKKNLRSKKKINTEEQFDIKLELDVRCQKLIEKKLHDGFREIPVLGEEGNLGDMQAPFRWVVDPIDGTVNFAYGIPHACISIALQKKHDPNLSSSQTDGYETVVGVVYDPFCDELWTAVRGGVAYLNRTKIQCSQRRLLNQTIVTVGFAKKTDTMEVMLPTFNHLVQRVRKIRIMGSAALAMVYVATGRFDAYLESGVRLWDIAAGGLILECAGGEFWRQVLDHDHTYAVIATNGQLRSQIEGLGR